MRVSLLQFGKSRRSHTELFALADSSKESFTSILVSGTPRLKVDGERNELRRIPFWFQVPSQVTLASKFKHCCETWWWKCGGSIFCIHFYVTIDCNNQPTLTLTHIRCEWDFSSTDVELDPRFAGVSLFRTMDVPPALITVVPDPATWRSNNAFSTSSMTENTSAACSTAWKQK